jgi:hypothetical protein
MRREHGCLPFMQTSHAEIGSRTDGMGNGKWESLVVIAFPAHITVFPTHGYRFRFDTWQCASMKNPCSLPLFLSSTSNEFLVSLLNDAYRPCCFVSLVLCIADNLKPHFWKIFSGPSKRLIWLGWKKQPKRIK